jgi:hypothetical protein
MINGYIPPFSPFGLGMLQPPDSNPQPSFAVDVPIAKPTTKPIRVVQEMVQYISEQLRISQQLNKFDILLHSVKGGPILCKRKCPAPPLDDIDPRTKPHYDEATYWTRLRQELNLTHHYPPMWEGIFQALEKNTGPCLLTKVYSYPSRTTSVP